MLLGIPRGAFTSIGYVDLQPPRGYFGCFNKNIVGIYSPKIWPQGGLRGLWVFSGDWVYMYIHTPHAPCVCPVVNQGFYLQNNKVNPKNIVRGCLKFP